MSADIDLLALALVVLTLTLVLSKPRLVRSEGWTLFRSLLPSWRFFEAIAPVPTLHVRTMGAGGRFGSWTPALEPPRRRWYAVVLNAEGNLHLAYASVIERLVQELDAEPVERVGASTSYRLLRRIVESAPALAREGRCTYQFKLQDADGGEPVFVSPNHQRSEGDDARRC